MAMNREKLSHRERKAALYVRQSSGLQVRNNIGSTAWQMSLVDQLIALGWSAESVMVFDDLGISSEGGIVRGGFSEMLEYIRLRKLGIVMVVEETRIARNEEHWGRLMDVMARTDTLFYCNDQLLDLNNLDDRMEASNMQAEAIAEGQERRQRLSEGRLALAREGKYKFGLPIGYEYHDREIIKSVDERVRSRIELIFQTFQEIGTANGAAHHLVRKGIDIPRLNSRQPTEVVWVKPTGQMIDQTLLNPIYSGTYVYGKIEKTTDYDSNYDLEYHFRKTSDPDQWKIKIHNAFEGYITWEQYLKNREQLTLNAPKERAEGGAVREGQALLQGIIRCGACGQPLYSQYGKDEVKYYACSVSKKFFHEKRCKSIRGDWIDHCVSIIVSRILSENNLKKTIQDALRKIENEKIKEETGSVDLDFKITKQELKKAKKSVADALHRGLDAEIFDTIYQKWKSLREKYDMLEKAQVERDDEQTRTSVSITDLDTLSDISELFKTAIADNLVSIITKKKIIRCIIQRVEVIKNSHYYLVIHWHSGSQTSFHLPPRPRKKRVTRSLSNNIL